MYFHTMSISLDLTPAEADFVKERGGAKWIESIVRQKISESSAILRENLPEGYQVTYDDEFAKAQLPQITERIDPDDPAELEAVYYRIVKDQSRLCIQYIYYWNFQVFPPHSYDYEPIYVYFEKDQANKVAFDFWHYTARVISGKPPFLIWGPWHSFTTSDRQNSNAIEGPLLQLDPAVLDKWYNRKPKSKFEISQKLTDPWLLRDWSTFRDERILPQVRGLTMAPNTRIIIESDEAVQAATNRQLFLQATTNIDDLYHGSVKRSTVARLIPENYKTKQTVSEVHTNAERTRKQLIYELQGAGYLKVREGHASWTCEGKEVRKILKKALDMSGASLQQSEI